MLDDHDEDNRPLEPGLPPLPSHEPSIPPIPRDALLPGEARGSTEPAPPLSQPEPTIADVLQAIGALRAHVDGMFRKQADEMLDLRMAIHDEIETAEAKLTTEIAAVQTILSGEVEGARFEIMSEISLTRQELHARADGLDGKIESLRTNLFGTSHSAMAAHDAIGGIKAELKELHSVIDATYVVAAHGAKSDDELHAEQREAGQ